MRNKTLHTLLALLAAATAAAAPVELTTATAEQKAGIRSALGVQAGGAPALLERFGRLAETTSVTSGSSPEIGPAWFLAGSGAAGATVQNEALTAASGTLLYIGSTVPCPDNKISIVVMAELYANPSYTSGTTTDDLTFGINSRAFDNLASFLDLPQKCIHAQLRSSGEINGNLYSPEAAVTEQSGATTLGVIPPINTPFPIRITVDANRDELTFAALGRVRTYRDSRYSDRVSATATGFFIEWSGGTSSTQYLWRVHSILVNGWEMEQQILGLGGEYGAGAASQLASRTRLDLQGKLRVETQTAFGVNQTPSANDSFAGPGRMMLGTKPYYMPAQTLSANLTGVIQQGTDLLSAAPATDQALHTVASMEALVGYGNSVLNAGSVFRTTYLGQLGANGNTKRIKIKRSAGGATRFDSGDLTDNGTAFTLDYYQIRKASAYRFVTVFALSGQAQVVSYNADATGAADQLLVTGTAAGDVTIHHHATHLQYVP